MEMAEEYDRRGFLVFDPEIDPAVIDRAAQTLRDLYLPEGASERSATVCSHVVRPL